jgi:hypothetical protein
MRTDSRRIVPFAFGAALALTAFGCSSSSTSPAGTPEDAGAGADGAASSSGGSDGSGSGGNSDAGSSSGSSGSDGSGGSDEGSSDSSSGGTMCGAPVVDGGTCAALTAAGPMVAETCGTGTPPAQTGGTIADGTYVLESATDYACEGGVPSSSDTTQVTFVFSGGCFQWAVAHPGTQGVTSSGEVSTSSTTLTLAEECPMGGTGTTVSYSANATGFTTLASSMNLEVYTKQ